MQNSAKKVKSWVKSEARIRKWISKLSFNCQWICCKAYFSCYVCWIILTFFPWIKRIVIFRNLGLMLDQAFYCLQCLFKWKGNNFLWSDMKHRISILKNRETENRLIAKDIWKMFQIFHRWLHFCKISSNFSSTFHEFSLPLQFLVCVTYI